MTRQIRPAALAALLAVASFAPAQSFPNKVEPIRGKAAADVYEDIEVMRRLLAERLAANRIVAWESLPANQNSPNVVGQVGVDPTHNRYYLQQRAPGDGNQDLRYQLGYSWSRGGHVPVEGVYLDGKGIVFTSTLPKPARDPVATTSPVSNPNPDSDWDRARRQVLGEREQPAAKHTAVEPSTTDVILRVLSENGRHLRMRDNEDVIVVVTFRGDAQATVLDSSNSFSNFANAGFRAWTAAAEVAKADNLVSELASGTQEPGTAAGPDKTAHDFELLGDLHMRQKQYQQAAEAYANALKKKTDDQSGQELYRKAAEARMQLGELEAAKTLIDKAIASQAKKKPTVADAATSPKPTAMPAKLIITVSKRNLDDVGNGKLSLDDFRKGAKIDYFPFGERQ